MSPARQRGNPLAEALEWVTRITTVALIMVLPGVAGAWADGQSGTGFLMLIGLVLGLVAGMWQLLAWTKAKPPQPPDQIDPPTHHGSEGQPRT